PVELYNRVKDKVAVGGAAAPAGEDNGIMLMPNVPVSGAPQSSVPADEDNGLMMMPNLSAAGTAGGGSVPKLDLNNASVEQLVRLPGIDESKARMIVAYRFTYGKFTSAAQLRNVPLLAAEDVATLTQYAEVR
ncbi:MAG TPA: helix-hairpin-helix domain-containing protein, partial [bacterium]|nr:helix-hairpin-helix domain-containing protein [bacterium]